MAATSPPRIVVSLDISNAPDAMIATDSTMPATLSRLSHRVLNASRCWQSARNTFTSASSAFVSAIVDGVLPPGSGSEMEAIEYPLRFGCNRRPEHPAEVSLVIAERFDEV